MSDLERWADRAASDVAIKGCRRTTEPFADLASTQEAVEIVRAEADRHFDPVLVDAFLRSQDQFDEIRARCAESLEPAGAMAT